MLAKLMQGIRKTKCSGHPPPCQMCEQLDTACVVDLTLDMRRRTALQRTMEESRAFQDTLKAVIGILRSGDSAEIQDFVMHIQRKAEEEDALEALQNELQRRGKSESVGLSRKIKEEEDGNQDFGLEEEEEGSTNELASTPSSARKRTFSMQGGDPPRPLINPLQRGSSDSGEGESLASRYLPLISKLRTASDREATRILHDLRTSPVSTEDLASLNLLGRRHSRPNLNIQTNQYSGIAQTSSLDRANWHPSLRITRPDLLPPLTSSPQGRWNEQSSDISTSQVCMTFIVPAPFHYVTFHYAPLFRKAQADQTTQPFNRSISGQTDSGTAGMASHSDPGAPRFPMSSASQHQPSSLIAPSASPENQAYSVTYNATQVQHSSPVLEMFGDLRALGASNSGQYHTSLEEFTVRSSATIPVYLIQSRLIIEDSPLNKVSTGFRDAARHMIATGTPEIEIVNGTDVVVDLFFRERWLTDGFTCSSWACELCRSFGEVDNFVRLACVFLLTRLMRVLVPSAMTKPVVTDPFQWMICPTPKTYSEIPESQRPTPTQCFIPHMPAIDLHPIPAMRDLLCHRLQDWVTPTTQTGLSCNWPLSIDEALDIDLVTGSIKVSKIFGEHVSRCENWSFNSYALTLYPELEGKVRIKDG
jgi:hypothetical protein